MASGASLWRCAKSSPSPTFPMIWKEISRWRFKKEGFFPCVGATLSFKFVVACFFILKMQLTLDFFFSMLTTLLKKQSNYCKQAKEQGKQRNVISTNSGSSFHSHLWLCIKLNAQISLFLSPSFQFSTLLPLKTSLLRTSIYSKYHKLYIHKITSKEKFK